MFVQIYLKIVSCLFARYLELYVLTGLYNEHLVLKITMCKMICMHLVKTSSHQDQNLVVVINP